ncbi:MAG: SET domain-containing protein-lysine N-methyltransferase [Endomicrobiales bacterium]|jgi:SET domain-containing protein
MKKAPRVRAIRTSNRYCYMAPSTIQGKGLFAREQIPVGSTIVEYDGPRLSRCEGERLASEGNAYVFVIDRRESIDGSVAWNLGRFANHCCEPNAKTVKIDGRIWLRSIKLIERGQEITYDYGYAFKGHENNPCSCRVPTCRGYIVPEKFRNRLLVD